MKTRFEIIRHGLTSWNMEKRIQGWMDIGLSARGKQEVTAWRKRLDEFSWDRIVTSDLKRAVETAKIINEHLNLAFSIHKELREQDWGDWAGMTLKEIKSIHGQSLTEQENAGWLFCPPRGEDRGMVLRRSSGFLKNLAERFPEEKILVVTHEGVIKCLVYSICQKSFLPEESPLLQPLHLHRLAVATDGRLEIERLNAVSLL